MARWGSDPIDQSAGPVAGEAVGAAAPAAEEAGVLDDLFLLKSAPLRIHEWLAPPVLVGLVGSVSAAILVGLAGSHELSLAGWAACAVSALAVAFAGALAWFGHRAYTRATVAAAKSFVIVRFAGLLSLASCAVVVGLVGQFLPVVFGGLGAVIATFWAYRRAQPDEKPDAIRYVLARIARLVTVVNGFVLVILPLVAVLVAFSRPNSGSDVVARLIGQAFVVPAVGVLVIIYALRARRAAPPTEKGGSAVELDRVGADPGVGVQAVDR